MRGISVGINTILAWRYAITIPLLLNGVSLRNRVMGILWKFSLKSHQMPLPEREREGNETNLCLFINRYEHWRNERENNANLRVHTINFIWRRTAKGRKRKIKAWREKSFSFWFFHKNCTLASQHKNNRNIYFNRKLKTFFLPPHHHTDPILFTNFYFYF